MARSKVGRGNYIIASILAVVGFFLGVGGWANMKQADTVFGQQVGSSLMQLGGLMFMLGFVAGVIYDIGNAIVDRLEAQIQGQATSTAPPMGWQSATPPK